MQYIDLILRLLIIILSGLCGYMFGILRERNFIKWRENRTALQSAYAYIDVLKARMLENLPYTNSLYNQLHELKYKQNFNIVNKKIFMMVRTILELPIYDSALKEYNPEKRDDFIKQANEILPILRQEMMRLKL